MVVIVNKRISWNLIRFPDYISHKNQKKNEYKYKQYKYNEACFRIIMTQIVTLFSWKLSIPCFNLIRFLFCFVYIVKNYASWYYLLNLNNYNK